MVFLALVALSSSSFLASSMAGALAAHRTRWFFPHLRPGFRPIWSFSGADADPSTATSPSSPASSSRSREKKLANRLSSVVDAINDRKLPPELRGRANAIRSETDIVNVVEQRIWHSMEEGHFENLPGKGKPLDLSTNPHADPAEDTLYRILSRNGCAPEWVELNKEIRSKIAEWRLSMKKAWTGSSDHDNSKWLEDSESLKSRMREINDKVLHYNLIVPFGRQMFGLKWEKEIDKLK
ncbi:putative DnaJ subfamily C, member 28 domain-containing protein [Dioscorea sansibarensis]